MSLFSCTADLKESQNETQHVTSPLNFKLNFGSRVFAAPEDDATVAIEAVLVMAVTDGGHRASSIRHLHSSILAVMASVSFTSASTSSSVHFIKISRS